MFKRIKKIIDKALLNTLQKVERDMYYSMKLDAKKKWDLETGRMFNDLIGKYPISEEELLAISETVCKFVAMTRLTNIDKYLFTDTKLEVPRLPYTL